MPDAKSLFFVHNQQPQIGKHDIFREEAMGPDQNVYFAGCQVLQNGLHFFGIPEAADQLDADRKGSKSALECLVVLERKHRGWREDGYLFFVAEVLERSA